MNTRRAISKERALHTVAKNHIDTNVMLMEMKRGLEKKKCRKSEEPEARKSEVEKKVG